MQTWQNEEQIERNRKNDNTQGWGVLQSLISPSKGNEKKEAVTTRANTWYS